MSQRATAVAIIDDKEIWYKYGVDYDDVIAKDGDGLTNLLEAYFDVGRRTYLQSSIEALISKPADKLKADLESAYASWLWGTYRTGHIYAIPKGFSGIVSDPENGIIVEAIKDFRIIWALEPHMLVEGDPAKGVVFGKRLLQAESIVLKIKGSQLEIRASRRGLKLIEKRLDELGAKKIENQEIEREIDQSIEELLIKGSEHLRVIGVKFMESSLPDKSKMVISNDLGIHNDIGFLKQKGLIPDFSITDVKSFELKVTETGKRFSMKVKLEDEGYQLEIDDKKLDENERENIRRLLGKAGIELNVRYKYQVKRNLHTIFHKILSGATRAYEEYFPNLPHEVRENLRAIASLVETSTYTCRGCKRENTDPGKCTGCGSKDLRENKTKRIAIDQEMIFDVVRAHAPEIGKTFAVDDVSYSNIKFAKVKDDLICEFTKTDSAKPVARAVWHKFIIVPFDGKRQLPKGIDEYMKSCALVIYGDAIYKDRTTNYFGTIDLFKLINSDAGAKRQLFHEMVKNSLFHIEDRIVPLSVEAQERLKEDGKLSAKEFERDIYYLIKRMHPLSERFGREGKRESDGLVMFSDGSDSTLVASYDAKHSQDLYKLDAAEQGKAAYYILDENMSHDIKLATNAKGIAAHIIISNALDKTKLKSFADGIKTILKLTKTGDEIQCSIVFLELKQLQQLFSIYTEYATVLKGDSSVHKLYHELTAELFSSDGKWRMIADEDISDFKGKLMQAIGKSPSLPHSI